jgi:hypothetical protein
MVDDSKALVRTLQGDIVRASGADELLGQIRREWRDKSLIDRVRRILPVDPSSACQRLLNAAIHDLRSKIVRAGIDVAKEAAARFKLPPVVNPEDITESYSTWNIINLAYRIGLLSRAEWRRLSRAYDIRRDLEHEDADYEANVEDILYVFKVSIEAVLSKEPIELLRVADVKALVDAAETVTPTAQFLADYEAAPEPRQLEILRYLVDVALDSHNADIVRANAVEMLRAFETGTKQQVKIDLAQELQKQIDKRGRLELVVAKVALAAGILPYIRRRQVATFFSWIADRLDEVGHGWRNFNSHGKLLDDFEDVGGLVACPEDARRRIVSWMTLCYLGEPGGYGWYGRNREVFYSNAASHRITRMFKAAGALIADDLTTALDDGRAKAAVRYPPISRRAEELRDYVTTGAEAD